MPFNYNPTPFKLVDNYIYFGHLDKFAILPSYPEQIEDSMTTTFASTYSLSRTAPIFSYIYSGPRTITISLNLHRDMMYQVNTNVSNLKDNVVEIGEDYVDVLIRLLQSISVPKYVASQKSILTPWVAVRFGNDIFIKGIVNGNINVTRKLPILSDGKYAQVSIGFSVSEMDPYDAVSIAEKGSFRGITSIVKSIYKEQ